MRGAAAARFTPKSNLKGGGEEVFSRRGGRTRCAGSRLIAEGYGAD